MKHPWRYRLEYGVAASLLALLRALPLTAASGLAGWLTRVIGPRLGVTRRAGRNLRRAMPELTAHQADVILGDVWENLGRMTAEFAHLSEFRLVEQATAPGDIEVRGREHLAPFIRGNKPTLMFAAHIGSWELQPLTTKLLGLDAHVVYRRANNPYVDRLIDDMRGGGAAGTVAKGRSGAREIIALLKAGRSVGMLIDQKLNDGIPVPFFGRDAMTAPALAQLALRYDLPVIPVRCERLGGCRFRVSYYPPLAVPQTDDRKAAVLEMMTEVNRMLETWIRERPGQWLWLHRRWPD